MQDFDFSSDATLPFAPFNSKCNDKSFLTYDVIKSYQIKSANDETYTLINHNYMAQYEKLYYGLVRVNTPTNSLLTVSGIEYEVYQSGNSQNVSSQLLLKGSIANTNVDCFTFPISDIVCDYFVKVTPSYTNTVPIQRAYIDTPKGEISLQDLRTQPQPPSIQQPYVTKGEMLFGIFYTARVINQRKDAKVKYLIDDNLHNYMTQTRLPRDFKNVDQIRQFREKDIQKIQELQTRSSRSTSVDTTTSNHKPESPVDVETPIDREHQTDIRQFYPLKQNIPTPFDIDNTPKSPEPVVPSDTTFIPNYVMSEFDPDEHLMYGFLNLEEIDNAINTRNARNV